MNITAFGMGPKSCSTACLILSNILNDQVSLPNSSFYLAQPQTYWSNQQAEVTPACYVEPNDNKDVAIILRVVETTQCQFAVRSGGHGAFAGASDIADGITISLNRLKQLEVSENRKTTYIGPGNTWQEVYDYLTPMNLSVIGGRVSGIGVGGLTLGGGISFFSGRRGWACDNVRNYEVVLAQGQTLQVNHSSYPDLYWALRGGGNNFGIVTRFDLVTFPQGEMWGGMVAYPIETNASLLNALADFAFQAPSDPDAAVILAFAYYQGYWLGTGDYEYAKPVVNPSILQNFTAIQPTYRSTMRIATLPELTTEFNASNPGGFRETYWTLTFGVSIPLLSYCLDTFMTEIHNVNNATGLLPALVLQAITKDQIAHMSKKGGNALGLSVKDTPLILSNLAIMWSDPADDARILNAANQTVMRTRAKAESMGLSNSYLYQNYAAKGQDVFAGYGEANLERLMRVSRKYDPCGVFQKLQPGYFKLPIADEVGTKDCRSWNGA